MKPNLIFSILMLAFVITACFPLPNNKDPDRTLVIQKVDTINIDDETVKELNLTLNKTTKKIITTNTNTTPTDDGVSDLFEDTDSAPPVMPP